MVTNSPQDRLFVESFSGLMMGELEFSGDLLMIWGFRIRHYCLVEMDMIGWFCWWHDDTPVVRR
ncbi:hypothetical protein Hanom_Chr15g01351541 [Helianthus anomalus]